jgi:hypothetical protein
MAGSWDPRWPIIFRLTEVRSSMSRSRDKPTRFQQGLKEKKMINARSHIPRYPDEMKGYGVGTYGVRS